MLPFLFMTIFYTLFKWYNGCLAGDGLSLEQGIPPDLLLIMLKNAFTGGLIPHVVYPGTHGFIYYDTANAQACI